MKHEISKNAQGLATLLLGTKSEIVTSQSGGCRIERTLNEEIELSAIVVQITFCVMFLQTRY